MVKLCIWAKMKFKMGAMCSRDDTGECDSKKPRSQITENIKNLTKKIEERESQIAEVKKQIAKKHEKAKELVKEEKREKAKIILRQKRILKGRLQMEEKVLVHLYATLLTLRQRQNERISQILAGHN